MNISALKDPLNNLNLRAPVACGSNHIAGKTVFLFLAPLRFLP